MDGSQGAAPGRPRRFRRGGLVLLVASLLLALAVGELGARLVLRYRFGISLFDPGKILYAFYPDLEAADRDRPSHEDAFFDVLLLGGSALHPKWGAIERVLQEDLAYRGHRRVRVYNMAMEGHTSRDSRLKYEALEAARFDLVIFYHGINEARANSVPPEMFRDDYGQFAWYESANALAPWHGRSRLALPVAMRLMGLELKHALLAGRYAPPAAPRSDWLDYGSRIASAGPFEDNLAAILETAWRRGDPVLVMTFATYVPEGYSRQEFKAMRLGYGLHLFPLELWGRADNVMAAIAAHNDVARRLAGDRPGVHLVDQARLMAGQPRAFNDPCHLTVAGSQQFVDHMLPVVLEIHEAVCRGCP